MRAAPQEWRQLFPRGLIFISVAALPPMMAVFCARVSAGAEFLRLCKDRFEARIRQVHAVDMGADLDAAETERLHAVFQFGDGELGRLQRHSPQRGEAVGKGIADFGQPRVDHAGCLAAQVGLDRIVVLQR